MKILYLVGAGGYAKSVLDSLDVYQYKFKGFIDDIKKDNHLGYPIFGDSLENIEITKDTYFFISIGDNKKRKSWFEKIKKAGGKFVNIIDASAIVSKNAKIGEGCFVGKMAIINSNVTVGDNCIINTKALVEHGCTVLNHVNVSTNAVLNGDVRVEASAFIGSSSVVNGQLLIGKEAIVGSGAVVVQTVPSKSTVIGIPAKIMKEDKK